MRKRQELLLEGSCFNKAGDDEMMFILLSRDLAASDTIQWWCDRRIHAGLNLRGDAQIKEALVCADWMRIERAAHKPMPPIPRLNMVEDRKTKCHVCGEITETSCVNCAINFGSTVYVCEKSGCRDHHAVMCWGTEAKPHIMPKPPFHLFKGATCKGSMALGNGCGRCEKCKWEQTVSAGGY